MNILTWACCSVLPIVFDNECLSAEELLYKALYKINELCKADKEEREQIATNAAGIEKNNNAIRTVEAQVEKLLSDLNSGVYTDPLINQMLTAVQNWVDNNMERIVWQAVKFVSFGLTPSGYFCANIPQTWQFLKFDTVMDTASPLFGHLVMCY